MNDDVNNNVKEQSSLWYMEGERIVVPSKNGDVDIVAFYAFASSLGINAWDFNYEKVISLEASLDLELLVTYIQDIMDEMNNIGKDWLEIVGTPPEDFFFIYDFDERGNLWKRRRGAVIEFPAMRTDIEAFIIQAINGIRGIISNNDIDFSNVELSLITNISYGIYTTLLNDYYTSDQFEVGYKAFWGAQSVFLTYADIEETHIAIIMLFNDDLNVDGLIYNDNDDNDDNDNKPEVYYPGEESLEDLFKELENEKS